MEAIDIDNIEDLKYARRVFVLNGLGIKKRIIIRCDASSQAGLGHYSRCLYLSKAFKRRGYESIFFLESNERIKNYSNNSVIKYVSKKKHQLDDARETVLLAKASGANIVIKDHFLLGNKWDEYIKKAGLFLVAFDELKESHLADIVIDYTPSFHRDRYSVNREAF